MLRAYVVRAGRREDGKKKKKMNIILYYIILYIYIYIDKVVNILPLRAKGKVVFAERFFFFDAEC